ncbi:MAG: helix-turn-helix domain-containing protein [Gammaproteobacteria bacterium]|nr:helix-turn-helix domain-containing protein [Gammaproteobacteria bacterium]
MSKKKNKPKNTNIEKVVKNLVNQYFSTIENHSEKGYLHEELIQRVEKELIKQVLKQTEDNQSQTAKLLGMSRTTLRKKMTDFGFFSEIDK